MFHVLMFIYCLTFAFHQTNLTLDCLWMNIALQMHIYDISCHGVTLQLIVVRYHVVTSKRNTCQHMLKSWLMWQSWNVTLNRPQMSHTRLCLVGFYFQFEILNSYAHF